MANLRSFQKVSPSLRPWVYFFIFFLANLLLSYFPLPLDVKWGIGLVGILLPFGWAMLREGRPSPEETFRRDFLPPLPSWAWLSLGTGAILIRFYRLTTLSVWPHYDEGWLGYYATELCNHWNWDFFLGNNEVPPVYTWVLALCFKLGGASLFTLWLVPALFSAAALVPAAWACRKFFPAPAAFAYGFLLAFSFWPWYEGRFSEPTAMSSLAEYILLLGLAFFLKAGADRERKTAAWVLGLVWTGFFCLFNLYGFVMAPIVVLPVAFALGKLKPGQAWPLAWRLSLPFAVAALPFLWLLWGHGFYQWYAGHLAGNFSFQDQWQVSLSYLASLFWGMDLRFATYQPVWGGLLNPVLDALFGLGLLEILRNHRSPFYRWLVLSFLLLLLPGVLSRSRETFRIIMLLPFLLAFPVLGLSRLLAPLNRHKALAAFAFLGLTSFLLDFHHLEKYHQVWDSPLHWRDYAKPMEKWRAFEVLQAVQAAEGPGLVFGDFTPGLSDQTLSVADYSFDALRNSNLDPQKAHWAAVLVNVNYRPFLERRFPTGKSYFLSGDSTLSDGGQMLWVMPLGNSNRQDVENWKQAQFAFARRTGRETDQTLRLLLQSSAFFQKDPFLRTCYGEMLADLYLRESGFKDFKKPVQILEEAARRGYPAAHLYFRMGTFWMILGDRAKADMAFRKAMSAPLNLTKASDYLSP